ncbi:MAG: methionyl-tRNA formyltransferase [Bacteroidetes bacterium]|nr:methionyl-tRNA formyltransferase [Bacteroidota bacterium]
MHPSSDIPHPTSRIVFYGTPVFAVESLKALVEGGYHVAGVVTAPDKPAGRGMKLRTSAVKQYALQHGLELLQPEIMSDPEFLAHLQSLDPDIQVVVAFRMLPRAVWGMPALGTFNLHASLLPQYRGAAPINWAIINGEKETGLTTFFLKDKVDTGDIIYRESMHIGMEETAGELHDRMMAIGAQLVVKTVQSILEENVITSDQSRFADPGSPLKPAPKIFTETCRIDWTLPSAVIFNLIRGLNPVPGAFTEIKLNDGSKTQMKIFRTVIEKPSQSAVPGTFSTDGRTFLRVSASDGDLNIYEMQLSGRKPMKTDEFLRGFGKKIF